MTAKLDMFVAREQNDENVVHVGHTEQCLSSSGHFLQVSDLCGPGDSLCTAHNQGHKRQ